VRPSIRSIQLRAAEYYRLDPDWFCAASRIRRVARPRQVAMYLSRLLTKNSLQEIGRRFGGRDHSTVIHAVRQVEKLRLEDAEMDSDIRLLTEGLRG
jgi:chromosomal replication initiator protein